MISEPKPDDEVKRLSKSDIQELNREGYNLDENKLYVIRFLFNDKMNKAYDPDHFQIDTQILDELASDAVDMPWIVPPYGINMHVRAPMDSKDPVKDLLELQKEFTIGKIKVPIRYPSNNVFGIIEVFPKFEGAVEKNLIPPLVSPTLNMLQMDGRRVKKAQFLNLQSVPTSGYPAQLTSITGMCKGGIKKCMEELAVMGAAGSETSKTDHVSFSNTLSNNSKSMSQDGEITLPQLAKTVDDHGRVLSELQKGQDEIKTAVSEIKTAIGGSAADGDKPKDAGAVAGAAGSETPKNGQQTLQIPKELEGNEFVKTLLEKQDTQAALIKKMNDEREEEKKKIAAEKRLRAATSIVTMLIDAQKVEEKNKEAEIKKYVALVDDNKNPVDLEPIEATLKSVLPTQEQAEQGTTIKGAYGFYSPDLKGDKQGQTRSNLERLGVI